MVKMKTCIFSFRHPFLIHSLIHSLTQETEKIIGDVLNDEEFRQTVANYVLIGSYTVLSNQGELFHPKTSTQDQDESTSFLLVYRWAY